MTELEISEAARLVNLKPHTLRYYESIGLIKNIRRNSAGKRIYGKADLKWLEFINRLRTTGMNISKMIEYTRLRNMGDAAITERKNILEEHLDSIDSEIKKLSEVRDYVAMKIEIYKKMEQKINGEGKKNRVNG